MMLIGLIISAYAITFVLVDGAIFNRQRIWIGKKTPFLQPIGGKHFLFCRMCVGFWVTLGVVLCYDNLESFFVVYGGSYFMATQER